MELFTRYYTDCAYGSYNCGYSAWNSYGRWIFLACVIVFALFVFFLFSCITARRRRKMGYRPYPGTGWAAGAPAGHGQAQYNPQPYYQNQPQPAFNNSNNPPPAYQTEQNAGYYNRDVELQQPTAAYKPPQGPPPGHNV
ncbi:hypothetical protein AMS68_001429 [Peltaster fructicola]|uniref:Chitin synthesis regulation, Congo red resistance, RCR protein n=1 Tax=Peltaster fructicola TaxID=286661 RepID=A0A6H0XMC9_9PEZI|nr:hypothetical protein AMS68_001429 [Peltaster fructicola]